MTERMDRLYERTGLILDGKANGFGMPILRILAHRRYGPAMLHLAARETESGRRGDLGHIRDAHSPAGLMYRAYRQGEFTAAQNFALTLFYLGDLAGYRHWLRRAAQGDDDHAAAELRRFETRQPWPLARRIGGKRPFRRDGS